jgi:hypothetical protein
MYPAFAGGRWPITSDDLIATAKTVVPLSKTAGEKFIKLRQWAVSRRARPTSAAKVQAAERTSARAQMPDV